MQSTSSTRPRYSLAETRRREEFASLFPRKTYPEGVLAKDIDQRIRAEKIRKVPAPSQRESERKKAFAQLFPGVVYPEGLLRKEVDRMIGEKRRAAKSRSSASLKTSGPKAKCVDERVRALEKRVQELLHEMEGKDMLLRELGMFISEDKNQDLVFYGFFKLYDRGYVKEAREYWAQTNTSYSNVRMMVNYAIKNKNLELLRMMVEKDSAIEVYHKKPLLAKVKAFPEGEKYIRKKIDELEANGDDDEEDESYYYGYKDDEDKF